MTEAEMYPGVDYPNHRMEFETFADLREDFEGTIEGLNFPVSWVIIDERDEDWVDGDTRLFVLTVLMPRKTAFTAYTTEVFERAEVEAWLASYIKGRVTRWYGWSPA